MQTFYFITFEWSTIWTSTKPAWELLLVLFNRDFQLFAHESADVWGYKLFLS